MTRKPDFEYYKEKARAETKYNTETSAFDSDREESQAAPKAYDFHYKESKAYANLQKKSGISWEVIAIFLVLFYPAGIILVIKRMNDEKNSIDCMASNAKKTIMAGWIYLGVALCYLIINIIGVVPMRISIVWNVIILVMMIGTGLFLLIYGDKYYTITKNYAEYMAVIKFSKDGSLDEIGQVVGKSYQQVYGEIYKLITMQFILDSYLDDNQRKLYSPYIGVNRQKKDCKVVKCPHCTAINKLENKGDRCEYCGWPLS